MDNIITILFGYILLGLFFVAAQKELFQKVSPHTEVLETTLKSGNETEINKMLTDMNVSIYSIFFLSLSCVVFRPVWLLCERLGLLNE